MFPLRVSQTTTIPDAEGLDHVGNHGWWPHHSCMMHIPYRVVAPVDFLVGGDCVSAENEPIPYLSPGDEQRTLSCNSFPRLAWVWCLSELTAVEE